MRTLNDHVVRRVDEPDFGLRRLSPQDEDDSVSPGADRSNDFVCEGFPASAFVRERLSGSQRQNCVQHQDSLLRPWHKASAGRKGSAHIALQFPENVSKRSRQHVHRGAYGEAKSVGHALTGIRILPKQ